MAYRLFNTTIRRPTNLSETNSTHVAEQKALDGTVSRDYIGSNKRVWHLTYNDVQIDDHTAINTIYENYVGSEIPVSWSVTDTNYSIPETFVHIDLDNRQFRIGGETALSDFSLILTEA